MSWNYRVVRRAWGQGDEGLTFLAIHEAHYVEGKEEPHSIPKEPVTVSG